MNIAKNLDMIAFYFPRRPAVIEGARQVSYHEFSQESNRVATALIDLGVRPGDRIALCAPNSYPWLTFYYGVLKAGAIAVTISTSLKKIELIQILDDAQPSFMFAGEENLGDIGSRESHPYLKKTIGPGGDISYERLIDNGSPSFKTLDRDREDTGTILYTGGTTGLPKGVMLTHENLMTSIHNVAHFERSTGNDCALCFLPLSHVFAQVHIVNSTIYSGGSVVILPGFDMEQVLHAIREHGVTKFYGVPTIYIRLLGLEGLKEKLSSLRYCFSAASSMAAELVREWKERTGLGINEAYGMTESASMVTYNHYYHHVIGSVGTPVNINEVQIRDLSGNVLGPGEEGEICVSGPNVMKGYLNNPEETSNSFWDRWFRSGDIGITDENGYLYIVDRIKDMIITGGENVYPREIEELLYTREEVQECAVIGLPHKEYGEQVTAFIVPKEGQYLDQSELKDYLKKRLSPFKVPKEFVPVAELPKSTAGKILKRDLRKQVTEDQKKGHRQQ